MRKTVVMAIGIPLLLVGLATTASAGIPVDTDKLHNGTGGWGANWFQDVNGSGSHDPGESFGDNNLWGAQGLLIADDSCWLASACNMLEQLGAIGAGQAQVLYNNYALNGVAGPGGATLTWDDGGLQGYAIQQWLNANPGSGVSMQIHTWSGWLGGGWTFPNGAYGWLNWDPRAQTGNYLAAGWEVGFGMWPLFTGGGGGSHEPLGHALTVQAINAGPPTNFDCTDSDRDSLGADVNNYADLSLSQFVNPNTYYGWLNDYYATPLGANPMGDVGYICAIIPEPATLMLLAISTAVLWRRRQ